MNEPSSRWQTEELSQAFLEGVRAAVPASELQLSMIKKISERWCEQPRAILDLGCGDGILGRLLRDRFPEAHVVFADFSEPMLDATRKKLGDSKNTSVVKADFSSADWILAVASHQPYDIVVSGFAIHHQPDVRKQELYAEVYSQLRTGGLFLNLEHVASATPACGQLFDEFFVDHLYAYHKQSDPTISRDHVNETYYKRSDKKENILASVDVQCDWLRRIGFVDVDCYFKAFELALFGGRKLSV